MKYLITGGTGFIGQGLCAELLWKSGAFPWEGVHHPTKVLSYSRRWDSSEVLAAKLNDQRLRVFNGDILNYEQLSYAMKDVDIVIHAAAYKSVPSSEYNFMECKRVNVDGTENVINAAIERGVKKVLFISSDKACDPINTYGRAKALGESMVINANNLSPTRFAVARYGNIMGSTGSVLPRMLQIVYANPGLARLPITSGEMTRFWFDKQNAVRYVLRCVFEMKGGETFIPKLKASTINSFVEALSAATATPITVEIIGIRPGEKMHEAMISRNEISRTVDVGFSFVIKPFSHDWDANWYLADTETIATEQTYRDGYTSYNAERMTQKELETLINLARGIIY